MRYATLSRMKRIGISVAVTMTLLAGPFAPLTAGAGGLADLLTGTCVTDGCSRFIGPAGFPVSVKHYLPKANCPSPAVIILHGSDGDTRYAQDYEKIGRGLATQGYAAFIVHYYEGEPRAPRPGPNDRALPDPRAFVPWTNTVEQAVSYVQSFPGVDPARVGILGMSLGGFVGASVASNDPRVQSLVILSGGMPDMYANDMRVMPPTLIVHGDRDPDVPVWEAYELHGRMTRLGLWHEFVILPCEGHLPYRTFKETVAKDVLEFFDKTL